MVFSQLILATQYLKNNLIESLFGDVFVSNRLGRRGEDAVSSIFGRDVLGKPRFSTHFLGEKAELLDFVVNLVDEKEAEIGPFFMLQVKTTKGAHPGKSIDAPFSAAEVAKAVERKVPVYVVAVDAGPRDEKVYFLAVESTRKGGISTVPRLFNLDCEVTLEELYDEVFHYFMDKPYVFKSKFVR